jgi:hypothetical protein
MGGTRRQYIQEKNYVVTGNRSHQRSACRHYRPIERALEDTEYLFICDGPVVYFDDDGLTGYLGWEEIQHMKDSVHAEQ